MGNVLSFFRRKPVAQTVEVELTELAASLRDLRESEAKSEHAISELMRYRFVSWIYALLGVLLFVAVYKLVLRRRESVFIVAFIILLAIISVVYSLRLASRYYHNRQIRTNRQKQAAFQERIDKLLNVVTTELPYSVAVRLLNKYGPLARNQAAPPVATPRQPIRPENNVRQRIVANTNSPGVQPLQSAAQMARSAMLPSLSSDNRLSKLTAVPSSNPGFIQQVAESFLGWGAEQRYALICSQCASHNGLALPDEFPYVRFRCHACQHPNPPRIVRPSPPRMGASSDVPTSMAPGEVNNGSGDSARTNLEESPERALGDSSKDPVGSGAADSATAYEADSPSLPEDEPSASTLRDTGDESLLPVAPPMESNSRAQPVEATQGAAHD